MAGFVNSVRRAPPSARITGVFSYSGPAPEQSEFRRRPAHECGHMDAAAGARDGHFPQPGLTHRGRAAEQLHAAELVGWNSLRGCDREPSVGKPVSANCLVYQPPLGEGRLKTRWRRARFRMQFDMSRAVECLTLPANLPRSAGKIIGGMTLSGLSRITHPSCLRGGGYQVHSAPGCRT